MLVNDLNHMEKIVESQRDLYWDGWNVVKFKKDPSAFTSVNGVFRNGHWGKTTTFPVTERGWDIPENIGSAHAKMAG